MTFLYSQKKPTIYVSHRKKNIKKLFNNITKSYRKPAKSLEKAINMEAKNFSKKLELDNRIEYLAKNTAFISLKDHKANFQSSLPCRLINLSKSDNGKISKSILDKFN